MKSERHEQDEAELIQVKAAHFRSYPLILMEEEVQTQTRNAQPLALEIERGKLNDENDNTNPAEER